MKGNFSESEIIQGCKRKKEKFQEMLYRMYYGYAMSISLRYASSADDAVEITNDSFLKVFDNIGSFNEQFDFKPWLRKILVNLSIDYYRKRMRMTIMDARQFIQEEEFEPEAVQNLNAEDIIRLLNELPETYRITFNLYEMEGFSHEEIAAKLGVSTSTSRSNLTRAKQLLRLNFNKHFQVSYAEVV